ncbi:MAG TPA: ABC transporter substrate-binding protein [Methylomirabilota bacterium]|jgi:iron(III) transport system substrate-binding protein|nr:ABC transporter substrate-binding protein [Methylomirabilota bacterium]
MPPRDPRRLLLASVLSAALLTAGPATAQGRPVMVYGVIHEYTLARLMQLFERQTGGKADFIRLSAGEVATRVQAERQGPKGDVIFGISRAIAESMKAQGLLEPYPSPRRGDVPARYSDAEAYWTGSSLTVQGIMVNTERWKKELGGAPMPKTWEDLLDPKYQGLIVAPSPLSSGTGFTFVVGQFFRLGEEKGWEYLKALDRNVRFYTPSGIAPARMVAAGEFLIAITFAHDALKAISAGYPVALVHPPGASWDIGSVSLIKGGPNPEGGKRFIDWVLGRDPIQLIVDLNFEGPLRADVSLPLGATPLEKLDLVDYKLDWAAQNRSRVLKLWGELFKK